MPNKRSEENKRRRSAGRPTLGPPEKPIDMDKVFTLARHGCTNVEIADICAVSDDTLVARCSDILRKARGEMRDSLRNKQHELAESGNVTLLIWLGKQLLGQKDRVDHTSNDETIIKHLHGVDMAALHGRGNGNGKAQRNGNGHAGAEADIQAIEPGRVPRVPTVGDED